MIGISASTDNERWYLALTALWAARPREHLATPEAIARAQADVRFAVEVMDLRPGSRVLDLACAWGRTTLELARRGYQVLGFDLSPDLLAIAGDLAAAEGRSVPYVAGTVRCLPEFGRFDAVTAFYDDSVLSFEDEADNLAALAGVARALRPGGAFLFGTTDCPPTLPPVQVSERHEAGERLVEEIRFDTVTSVGLSVRAHQRPDGSTLVYHRVRRHYTPDEAGALLRRAGLTLKRAWCAYDHTMRYGRRPEGMVLLAAKS